MNTAILGDRLQLRINNVGIWLLIILVEICIAAIGTLFPIKPMIVVFIGVPFVFYLFLKPFHAYLLTVLMLPFWEVTLHGIESKGTEFDIRYTQIATLVAVLSWLFNGLTTKKLHFEKNVLIFPLAVLTCWILLSFFWVGYIYSGIRDSLLIFYGITVFFLTINSVKDEKTLSIAIKIWTIAGLLCALIGMVELITTTLPAVSKIQLYKTSKIWGEDVRISGLKESTHRLGMLLNMCLMITVPQLIVSKSRKYKLFLIFCIFCMLIVLINTMSRTTWVACFVGIACFSFYSKRLAKPFLISCLALLVLFLLFAPGALQHAVVERFKGVLDPTGTSSYIDRISVWESGLKMFVEHPLTGVGIGTFSALAKQYGSVNLEGPHNIFLFFLSESGIIGLSIFLFFIFTIATSIIKGFKSISNDTNKFILFGISVGLLMYFTHALDDCFKLVEMEFWALLGLAMAALKIFTSEKEKTISKPFSNN